MPAEASGIKRLSPAQWTGGAAVGLWLALLPIDVAWAALPPAAFILLCAAASFRPRSSFFLPVISCGRKDNATVALTFDDGPDPLTTPALLDLLAEHGVRATFFVAGRAAERHPDLIRAILSRGHTVGNHSYSHTPLLMLQPSQRLFLEIADAQDVLEKQGIRPLAFRPPVGLTNPKLRPALSRFGMICVTFSCRAYDRGNRRIRDLAAKVLRKVKAGDIILLHDVRPTDPGDIPVWLREVEAILAGLGRIGLAVAPLEDLIGRPVMATPDQGTGGCRDDAANSGGTDRFGAS